MTDRIQELQQELEQIPRGHRGSLQNMLRMRVWFWLVQGHTFVESLAESLTAIRQEHPDFEPRLQLVKA